MAQQRVLAAKERALGKCAANLSASMARKRHRALEPQGAEATPAAPPAREPLAARPLAELRSSVEKVAAAWAAIEPQVGERLETLSRTIQGVAKSIELRTAGPGSANPPSAKKAKASGSAGGTTGASERFAAHLTKN